MRMKNEKIKNIFLINLNSKKRIKKGDLLQWPPIFRLPASQRSNIPITSYFDYTISPNNKKRKKIPDFFSAVLRKLSEYINYLFGETRQVKRIRRVFY